MLLAVGRGSINSMRRLVLSQGTESKTSFGREAENLIEEGRESQAEHHRGQRFWLTKPLRCCLMASYKDIAIQHMTYCTVQYSTVYYNIRYFAL